jgi:dTDP-4-dehydrorhamnose reductase
LSVAVIGSNGLLGREVTKVFKKECEVVELPHDILDITDLNQVLEALSSYMPTVLVNCAAYTAVDRAEEEPEKANLVNGLGVRNLALACRKLDISLVHISTDYVFNGNTDTPWHIFDERDPINAYGYSKYLGERYLETINPKYFLVRTSWLFGSGGPNFVSTILRAALKKGELRVVNDQFGCPTYALDLACFLLKLVKTGAYGVYHVTNQGITSWYEFAKEIVKQAGIDIPVVAVSSDEYTRPAKRPKNSALDPFPLNETVGILPPSWQDALSRFLSEALTKECLD